jgi:hypothetical protein
MEVLTCLLNNIGCVSWVARAKRYTGGGRMRALMEIWRKPIHGTAFRALITGSDLVLTIHTSGVEALVNFYEESEEF